MHTFGGGGGNLSAAGVLERLHLLGIRLPKNDVRGEAPPDFASRPVNTTHMVIIQLNADHHCMQCSSLKSEKNQALSRT